MALPPCLARALPNSRQRNTRAASPPHLRHCPSAFSVRAAAMKLWPKLQFRQRPTRGTAEVQQNLLKNLEPLLAVSPEGQGSHDELMEHHA
eukprot:CAMPEP_0115603330 /NCGR_PEP_ID=MMETSP0272-20121206/16370_1 /TAXON_ID=71861 /ORGANISM="Scrippsiella trochoidea, Strain CCMP3099" /LENGTH=90 /DNA_ID=CAMNT_0003038845 /DNA_START=200 /DNA_END=469 /DNA_ORIENTATION=+